MKKILPILILLLPVWWLNNAKAQEVICSVQMTPTSMEVGSSGSLNFNVSNTSGVAIGGVLIRVSNDNVIGVTGGSASGWSVEQSSDYVNFSGNTFATGGSASFAVSVTAGLNVDSTGWSVAVTDSGGGGLGNCEGETTTSITAPAVLPQISNASLTVGNSSATLTWNTDVEASGVVNFGTTSGYGSSTTTASGTSHAATLSGLSASTEYHYQIQAVGEGTTSTTDATFTTSAASVTTTTTTTVTSTQTVNTTVNKTVILADTVKPVVKIESELDKALAQAPIIEGKVVDTGAVNVGIVKIQYSVDNGKSWLLVDEPSGATKADFSFVPEVYEDGNYQILVRATDKSGNTGVSSMQTLVIDRLPPRIIHSMFRVGPIILSAPYQLIPGGRTQISVAGVGGVTEMNLIIGEESFTLIKNFETALWEGEILIESAGEYEAIIFAKDGGGGEIRQKIAKIVVLETGKSIASETLVSVYRFDELIKRFKLWNGSVYGQDNPSKAKTSWYLPPGKYYIEEKAAGYQTSQSEIFTTINPGVVAVSGEIKKWNLWNWWKKGNLELSHLTTRSSDYSEIMGKIIKWIEGTEYRGREFNLIVVPIWEPRLAGILAGLVENDVVVIPGSNQSSVDLLKERGNYKMVLRSDPDGEILSDLRGTSLPINLSINRRGQVEGVK